MPNELCLKQRSGKMMNRKRDDVNSQKFYKNINILPDIFI
jgi:hypothetical protein